MERRLASFGALPRSVILATVAGSLLTIGLRGASSSILLAASFLVAIRAVGGLAYVRVSAMPMGFELRGPLTRVALSVVGAAIPLVAGLSLAMGVKAGAAAWPWPAAIGLGMIFTVPTWWFVEAVMVTASFRAPYPVLKARWRERCHPVLGCLGQWAAPLRAARRTVDRARRRRQA